MPPEDTTAHMIDRRLLLTDFDESARRLARKGVDAATLGEARDLLETPIATGDVPLLTDDYAPTDALIPSAR